MPPEPSPWLVTAREHLVTAENDSIPIRFRCFHGQRAVEFAVKAVLNHNKIRHPHLHTIDRLLALVPDNVPDEILSAAILTPYAVEEQYPDTYTDLSSDHANEAVQLARTVVEWAEQIIN